ncbi:DUF58 domain-containing protein [Rheinheimera sp.]|uniref:DUF58 domain-containing protein n=1 Tax=Rheinheimera sp. TaxID=1869214 RepID=UPI00307F7F99
MQNAFSVHEQLRALKTNGIDLDLAQLLAYQRFHSLLDLSPKMAIQSKLAGSYLAKTKGRGMEFDEVRHYQTGDDVRTIDWRVTARTGKMHTKLFREEKERPVFILTDLSDSMQFGSSLLFKSVQAAHLAALLAWHVKERGDKLGGLVFSQEQLLELKPAARSQSVLRYLNAMLRVQQGKALPSKVQLDQALALLRRLVHPGALVYLLSDFSTLTAQGWRHIQAIRQHNEVCAVQILDPLDSSWPVHASGGARISNGEEEAVLDLGSGFKRQQYQLEQQQQQQQLQLSFQQLGCRFMQLSSGESLLQQLNRSWGHGR